MLVGSRQWLLSATSTRLYGSAASAAVREDGLAKYTFEDYRKVPFVAHRLAVWAEQIELQKKTQGETSPEGGSEERVSILLKSPLESAESSGSADSSVASVDSGSSLLEFPRRTATPAAVLASLPKGGISRLPGVVAALLRPLKGGGAEPAVVGLDTPITTSSSLSFLTFNEAQGREVLWHSAAHVLGQALEMVYGPGAHLCDGPPLTGRGGFFYDVDLKGVSFPKHSTWEGDRVILQGLCSRIIALNEPFERLEVTRAVALRVFESNPHKVAMLERIPPTETISLYKSGAFVDLCRGPHVAATGAIGVIDVVSSSGAHFGTGHVAVTRVVGSAFPSRKHAREWEDQVKKAEARDHRVLGPAQGLIAFHELAPGGAFWLPHGTRILNALIAYINKEYRVRGFTEVVTPLLFKKALWETSGHWAHYANDMFLARGASHALSGEANTPSHVSKSDGSERGTESGGSLLGLKPMNCPGHCLVFASKPRSHRELPLRFAEFSPLHRNELTGALSGLTRLTGFRQDDAHIFCTVGQVKSEIGSAIEFLTKMYDRFGFTYSFKLATRPQGFLGELALWDTAETALKEILDELRVKWTLVEGDGAFYGPKIDVQLKDALSRSHQCGTIQLDFQLPQRFGLKYTGSDGALHQPVIIHRAVLGSLERMTAILIEHTGGDWPLWLSPRQIMIASVDDSPSVVSFCTNVGADLRTDYHVDVDASSANLKAKIKKAQQERYNYIAVVGKSEVEKGTVAVRRRSGDSVGQLSVIEFKTLLATEVQSGK